MKGAIPRGVMRHAEATHARLVAAANRQKEDSDHLAAIARGNRWCYFVPLDSNYDGKGFVPSLVVEGIAGHVPMTGQGEHAQPWYWGNTYEDAVATCKNVNRKRGISELAAAEIVATSMGASNRGREVSR